MAEKMVMMQDWKANPGVRRLLSLGALALATGGLAGCYYAPPVAYCQAPPANANGQPQNVPLQPNGACPEGTQPIYAQAQAPAYGYPPPAYAYPAPYPYYPYAYPAYPPVSVGFGFRFR